jgi:hypothetical protein
MKIVQHWYEHLNFIKYSILGPDMLESQYYTKIIILEYKETI